MSDAAAAAITTPHPQSDHDYEIYPISLATESVNRAPHFVPLIPNNRI